MLEPFYCGLLLQAPLLPKLRGYFAEFLNNASSVGLRILSSSTCVGLWYGYVSHNSGFSRHTARILRYFDFAPHKTLGLCEADLLTSLLMSLHRSLLSRLMLSACVPTFLMMRSTGISTCCPSATPFGLVLGPDLPRADQLYPGNLGYSAGRILTFLSLLIPAFSLHISPRLLPVPLRSYVNAPLPVAIVRRLWLLHGFGVVFQPRVFSAQDLSASELLRTL